MAMLTIGIPVYNEEKYLRATICSALTQSFTDIEVIICDNCSTDKSFAIAQEYADTDSRVRLVRHLKNIGALENFRSCLDQANTKYFVWLSGHDIFCVNYIETAIKHLESHPEVVLVYPKDAVFINNKNEVIRAGACSNIEARNVRSPVDRMIKVVRNLGDCTNIHGVFLTEVAKKLPFEVTIGPDFLQLAITALFGEVHALSMEGIRRREIRKESALESKTRWEKEGVFVRSWHDPYVLLVLKHIKYVIKNKNVKIVDKIKLCILLPGIFNDKGLVKWRRYFFHNSPPMVLARRAIKRIRRNLS